MGYIDNNLLPGESILFRTKKHLIIFFLPVVCTILSVYASRYLEAAPILVQVAWAPWLVSLILWAYAALEYFSSDFAVTNKRVMMREGFFYRHGTELRLATVSQVNVDQSLLGQLFDYGQISINAFGAMDAFTWIAKPVMFQKKVNEQLDKIVS